MPLLSVMDSHSLFKRTNQPNFLQQFVENVELQKSNKATRFVHISHNGFIFHFVNYLLYFCASNHSCQRTSKNGHQRCRIVFNFWNGKYLARTGFSYGHRTCSIAVRTYERTLQTLDFLRKNERL